MTIKNTPAHKPLTTKKRLAISYSNMTPQLMDIWKEKYPRGYADYMEDIMKVDKADGSFFYAVTLEIPDAIYLVKVEVKIDDYDEVEKDIFGGSDDLAGSDAVHESIKQSAIKQPTVRRSAIGKPAVRWSDADEIRRTTVIPVPGEHKLQQFRQRPLH